MLESSSCPADRSLGFAQPRCYFSCLEFGVCGNCVLQPVYCKTQFLQLARDSNGPALVAKITADLTHNLRIAIRCKRYTAFAVKAIGGFEKTDIPDLPQVVHGLAPIRKSVRNRLDEPKVSFNELVAARVITLRYQVDLTFDCVVNGVFVRYDLWE
jgi:hypothetical protein